MAITAESLPYLLGLAAAFVAGVLLMQYARRDTRPVPPARCPCCGDPCPGGGG